MGLQLILQNKRQKLIRTIAILNQNGGGVRTTTMNVGAGPMGREAGRPHQLSEIMAHEQGVDAPASSLQRFHLEIFKPRIEAG